MCDAYPWPHALPSCKGSCSEFGEAFRAHLPPQGDNQQALTQAHLVSVPCLSDKNIGLRCRESSYATPKQSCTCMSAQHLRAINKGLHKQRKAAI